MATLPELLKTTVELNGSDLHLSIQSAPVLLRRVGAPAALGIPFVRGERSG